MKYLEEAKNILKVWWTKEIKGKSHINITAIQTWSWMLNKKTCLSIQIYHNHRT